MRTISIALLAAGLLGAAVSVADETAAAKPKPGPACFFVRDFGAWKPAADAKSIFIRVEPKRYLRLELASKCPTLTWPDARLITNWHTTSACDALDWDIKVSQGPPGNFVSPCIVKKVHEMTPEEVAALPKTQRP